MKNLEINMLQTMNAGTSITFKNIFIVWAIIFTSVSSALGENGHSKPLKPSFVTNIPSSNPLFVGRQEQIKSLRLKFQTKQEPGTMTIVGMAGVGKTQLAKQYAHDYVKSY